MSEVEKMEMHELQGKADAASAMMNSQVFNEAFQMMNQGIVDQILQTPAEAPEERTRAASAAASLPSKADMFWRAATSPR